MVSQPPLNLIAASAALVPLLGITKPVLAQRLFQIENNTGAEIINLYISSSRSQVWGLDHLASQQVIRNGELVNLNLSNDCLYDLKAELADGRVIEAHKVDACASSLVTLGTSNTVVSASQQSVNSSAVAQGFYCHTSDEIPETRYQASSGAAEVWIRWGSDFFSSAGYDPLSRCRAVSGRLENYRRSGKLNYMGVGEMNGQNIICTAMQPGNCLGLIYTLKPSQDPVNTLQQFIQHRQGIVGIAPLYESEDGERAQPFIDVRPFLGGGDSAPTPEVAPQPNDSEQLRPL